MTSHSTPIAYPVDRLPALRWIDRLQHGKDRVARWWRRWMEQRQDDSALQTLAHLDVRTLRDIGVPEEFRARAHALRVARSESSIEWMP